MPGNRQAYDEAMNTGHNAAWDQDWGVAIAAYGKAIHEFPEDPEAHIHLGLSLLEVGRLDDALTVYKRAHHLSPDDPIPLEKSADVLERMGRLREAAQQYVNVAEIYLGQRDIDKAIGNWERATRLTPGLIPIHAKLAQSYERIGDKKKAVREYLTLAFNFQRISDTEKAIKSVQRALRLERNNPQILNTLRALEAGGEILPPSDDRGGVADARAETFDRDAARMRPPVGESDPLGPMGEAMTDSLGLLATFLFEGSSLDAGSQALAAMEAQRQGFLDEAIQAYQSAEPHLRHPALKLNLGVLLLQRDRPADAVKHLGEAITSPQLAAGAFHALGQANFKLNKHRQAVRYLLQSLQAVDTSLAMDMEETSELMSIYEQLMTAVEGLNDESLSAINRRFIAMLQGKEWKQRIAETRRQLEETMREQGSKGVVDILVADRGDKLAESVARIDRYMRQGLLTLAMDEAHYAVEFSPYYLPIHVRMAEIMMREGRVRNAISKFNTIARSYMARGENARASEILSEVLELAPLDLSIRESLIELLEAGEQWDEALDHYIGLADTYQQLGNFDLARDTYQLAERMTTRISAPTEKVVRIKHRVADIDQMRLDMRRAQKTYEEIVQLAPDDERAHRMLVDLNYRQGNQVEAIRRLDTLLKLFARSKRADRIMQMLEELVMLYPNDTGLRSRLAAIYQQVGRNRDAIVQLDALGELQLEAGLHKDAAMTIRRIIGLNPDHVEDYRKLLAQLGG